MHVCTCACVCVCVCVCVAKHIVLVVIWDEKSARLLFMLATSSSDPPETITLVLNFECLCQIGFLATLP